MSILLSTRFEGLAPEGGARVLDMVTPLKNLPPFNDHEGSISSNRSSNHDNNVDKGNDNADLVNNSPAHVDTAQRNVSNKPIKHHNTALGVKQHTNNVSTSRWLRLYLAKLSEEQAGKSASGLHYLTF